MYSFLWKILCGLGSGLNSTASMAIIATHYRHDRERTIGLMESSSGLGLLLGPIFGAILYSIGGYMLPFVSTGKLYLNFTLIYTLAGLYFCLYPLIAFSLAKIQ